MKTLITATLLTIAAYAGPPMICHDVQIGSEKSLPWGTNNHWDRSLPSYDRARLVNDTLELLKPETPVMVRMETLRRAAIYAGASPAARKLAETLVNRAQDRAVDPMAWFDAGYFIEATHQLGRINKTDPVAGMDGYALAKRSLESARDRASVEYGLSLMQSATKWPNEHFARAKAGVKEGTLLALNIKQFESR